MDIKEIEPKIIKTYKMPFAKRFARRYNRNKYLLGTGIYSLTIFLSLALSGWNTLFLLYLLPVEVLFLYCLVKLFMSLTYEHKYQAWREETKFSPIHSQIYSGVPGMGKSLSASHTVDAMQEGSWEELQFEYWCLCSQLLKADYQMNEDDQEIFDAYQYMINNPGIPCCGTNIPFYSGRYRRFSYKFGPSYLKQERRAPYRLVGWYDEEGTVFNPQLAKDKGDAQKSLEMADTARFCRQFAELRFLGTEQDPNNIYINIRRVVGLNRVYISFKKLLQPLFLKWIYNKLKRHFLKHMSINASKRYSSFMIKFKGFINNIGFYRLGYKDIANTETGAFMETTKKNQVLYFPCAVDFKYQTRAFRAAYKPRKQAIKMAVFKSMDLEERDAEAFLRASYKIVENND